MLLAARTIEDQTMWTFDDRGRAAAFL